MCLLLARLTQQGDELLGIQAAELVAVDRQDLIAGRHTRFRRGRAGQGLQHDDAARQHGDYTAEAFVGGSLELPKLLKLAWIEKDGMRIEAVEHARNGALKESLLGGNRLGGVIFDDRVRLGDAFDAGFQAVVRREGAQTYQERENRGSTETIAHSVVLIPF